MSERVNVVVPDGQTATLMRGGKPLLRWPEKSIIDQHLDAGDQIVLSDNKPAPKASPLDVLVAKARQQEMELAATSGPFLSLLDEVLDALVASNVVRPNQLTPGVQGVLQKRKAIRARIAQLNDEIKNLVDKP